MTMSKRERVRRVAAGNEADRPPFTLWWHEFLDEWDMRQLEAVTVAHYRRFDWDLIKLNPRGTYFAEAWGARFEAPATQRFPQQLTAPISAPEDLASIVTIAATKGVLGEHLGLVKSLVKCVGAEVDVIHTVFSPLGILGMLCGPRDGAAPPADAVEAFGVGQRTLLDLAREDSAAVHRTLAAITETMVEYATAALRAGASGLFFAPMTWTSRRVCDDRFYATFGRPYDLTVLKAVNHAELNVLHVCGNDNRLDTMLDYPVSILNWADEGAGNASLDAVRRLRTGKALMGGVDPANTQRATAGEAREAIERKLQNDTHGVFIGGGCAMWPGTPHENYAAIGHAIRLGR